MSNNGLPVAEARANLSQLREALTFLLRTSSSSRPRILIGFDGALVFSRGSFSARVAAVGRWPGIATFSSRGVLEKIDHLRVERDSVALKVEGHRLWIGEFFVDCSWRRVAGRL